MRSRLFRVRGVVTLVIVATLTVAVFLTVTREPDVYDPAYIQKQSEEFLQEASKHLPEGETYGIVDQGRPSSEWLVLTIARLDPSLGEDTGSDGLIAIGHLEGKSWRFRLLGEGGFSAWLDQIPTDLLDPNDPGLKDSFRLDKEKESSSTPLQQLVSAAPKLAEEIVFNLPWKAGVSYPVTAGPGQGLHQGDIANAIDFGLPAGTPLLAPADADVIEVKDDSYIGGCDKKYANDANYIRLQVAPDKTVLYLHNQGGSVKVKAGDQVKAGQEIGRSGSTGFTCNWAGTGPGAHLHIVLEKPCAGGGWGCGSSELKFEEFKGAAPRKGNSFVSANQSPADRQQLAEEVKHLQELDREALVREQIQTALDNFYQAYTCSQVTTCKEEEVAKQLEWVTESCHNKLFGFTFCFGFGCEKDDALESAGEATYLSFPIPTSETKQLTVRVKGTAKVTRGTEITFHYTVTNVFLVKDKDGRWKVDDWDITCGYETDEGGKVIYTEDLEGCEWQPLSSGSW